MSRVTMTPSQQQPRDVTAHRKVENSTFLEDAALFLHPSPQRHKIIELSSLSMPKALVLCLTAGMLDVP